MLGATREDASGTDRKLKVSAKRPYISSCCWKQERTLGTRSELPHIRESKKWLDYGFLVAGVWIPDSSRSLDSRFQKLNSGSLRYDDQHFRTKNLTRRASKREKYMALIFILKCDHFSGMETKQTLVKERTEHVPYAAIIFLDLIHLLVFFYIYDALGRSSKSVWATYVNRKWFLFSSMPWRSLLHSRFLCRHATFLRGALRDENGCVAD